MLKKIVTVLILGFIIFAIIGLGKQIAKALQAQYRLDMAADNLSKLQEENEKLKKSLLASEQDDFVEKIARNKLLYARPNETIVIIPPDLLEKAVIDDKKIQEVKLPNWQGWWKLFFK